MFLFLGAVLLIYAQTKGITVDHTDNLFPTIALKSLGPVAGIIFLVGLISAAYPSADGALTSLTTIFCIDFLNFEKNKSLSEQQKIKHRYWVHISIAILFLIAILTFRQFYNEAMITIIYTIAGYTYGPLLGFYGFGLFTKRKVWDAFVPVIAILSPVITFLLSTFSSRLFWGYQISFELIIINGFLTFMGLLFISKEH